MKRTKIAITLDEEMLVKVDSLVSKKVFINRSRAIQEAVQEMLERLERGRLAKECLNLDPTQEKALAEEGLFEELATWPK
ncbi:MAG: CopG family transcriptional regulator [Gemmataceae bacterium]|nr:CopG family transcriptional regulator [Gemmataceae bacterium]